jgi:hypothetical protein
MNNAEVPRLVLNAISISGSNIIGFDLRGKSSHPTYIIRSNGV